MLVTKQLIIAMTPTINEELHFINDFVMRTGKIRIRMF